MTFMEYAWTLTPEQFTKPNGETILIDKTKRAEVTIPLDVAREVIRAGRLSAHAQACDLAQEQGDNHQSLMRRQVQSKKWTPQQMVYINQLHLTVVMLLTGRIKLVEKADDEGRKARPPTRKSSSPRSPRRPHRPARPSRRQGEGADRGLREDRAASARQHRRRRAGRAGAAPARRCRPPATTVDKAPRGQEVDA